MAVDGEVGAVHAAQVAATAFFRGHDMRWVVALRVKRRGQRQDFRGTELHAEAAGLAAFDDDADASFCQSHPPTDGLLEV